MLNLYAVLHGALALRRDGPHPAGMRLGDFFFTQYGDGRFHRLYDAKQALVVHATATIRERSHFDGQDVLESGMPGPGRVDSGWLNRAVAALPAGERVGGARALAVGATAPLVIRGPRRSLAGRLRASLRRPTISSRG